MTDESPPCLFLHDRGKSKAVDLARALKREVDTQRLDK
jgi:hypothetical protein